MGRIILLSLRNSGRAVIMLAEAILDLRLVFSKRSRHDVLNQLYITGIKSLGVITVLVHESGQFVRARFLMPIPSLSSTNVTQDAGAAITYARRYALSAVLGVASDDDTDAR